MKKYILIFFIILFSNLLLAQSNIGVGTNSPHNSAILDISSKTKGLLIPRMSSSQRTSIASPANGLMVYDTITNSLWYYNVNAWTSFTASGALSFPYSAIVNTSPSAFKIINQGFGAGVEGSSEADYGIGLRGSSTGVGGWGVNAVVNRNSSTAIYAFSDSGAVLVGSNQASNNIATLLDLTNKGRGKTAIFHSTNPQNNLTSVEINTSGIGDGLLINLTNPSNGSRGIDIQQSGVGPGVYAESAGGNAIWGITNSILAAGVVGYNYGGGEAVYGLSQNGGDGVAAVVGRNDSSGYGVRGFNTKRGIGVIGQAGISGGQGNGGVFENLNSISPKDVLIARGNGTGTTLFVQNTNISGTPTNLAIFRKGANTNVARIDDTGKGFFNGGTQNSGADVAEMFDISGERNTYEPGDVLVISTDRDRTIEKSFIAYSTLVVGVYATKPGVILTEENIDVNNGLQVPLGVIGVIPTKVCLEGGPIKRGDMLVTSSTKGVAMKADIDKLKMGQVIGKALENFDNVLGGKIKVMVNIK